MNIHFHPSTSLLSSEQLSPCLSHQLKRWDIPTDAKRLAMNLRKRSFYTQRLGHPPVEIHLERATKSAPWQIIVIASFGFIDENDKQLDMDLYFNLKRGWIYQPLTLQCNLLEPSALSLLVSFSNALAKSITNKKFDELTLCVSGTFTTPVQGQRI
ncbi:DUF2787 family protein [Vibrio sp. TBV020]|uniref:DUF2787 family protein n=1 Tax=Vibrio sp. TBV020 TaxID=3137398 RepID=UPI0038CD1C4C